MMRRLRQVTVTLPNELPFKNTIDFCVGLFHLLVEIADLIFEDAINLNVDLSTSLGF